MEQILESQVTPESARSLDSHSKSAVSWPAISAGAFVAASVSLLLVALGSGLGFASISPWPNHGISGTAFAVTTAIWLIVMQWVSAGFGGYIAGRLRTKWIGTHTHEVFFRDTAHGLVTWAVATVLVATILTTSLSSVISGGVHAAAGVASGAAQGGAGSSPTAAYGLDKLFRRVASIDVQSTEYTQIEAVNILANAMATGGVSDEDRAYLATLVTARAGVSAADAHKRVDDFIAGASDAAMKAKAAADAARRAAAQASIYTALSMLVGAFIASVSAALGGRLRDEHL